MELHQLRHFIAVAETGSFTKGAARASVSQPALSSSIAKLEEEFGVRLFDRSRTAVGVTTAGKKFLGHAKTILQACSEAKSELLAIDKPESVRMGVLNTLPTAHVAELVRAFKEAHPEVTVQLFDGSRSMIEERLALGKLDLGITTLTEGTSETHSVPLFTEPYVLVVGSRHRFSKRASIRLSDLEAEPFISRVHCETFRQTTELMSQLKIKVRVVYRTEQDDRVLGLVAAGLATALMPALFEAQNVVKIQIRDFQAERTIGLRWNHASDSPHVQSMLSFARSHDWVSRQTPQLGISRFYG